MSEPVRLDCILPQAIENIKKRCNRYRQEHGLPLLGEESKSSTGRQSRVIQATRDFISSKLDRNKKPERGSKVKSEELW